MNNEGVHKRKVISNYDGGSDILGNDNTAKEAAWQEAFRYKTFLFKDGEKLSEGEVDWSTFELILGTTKFTTQDRVNSFTMFKAFWRALWPYLFNLVRAFYELQQSWYDLVEDQDTVLTKYADQNFDLKIFKEYVAENMTDYDKVKWHTFYDKKKAEIEEKLENIRKEEALKALS